VRCCGWTLGCLSLLLASLPAPARAYEDQATLGIAVGYAGMPDSEALPVNGVDFAISAGGGIGDAWSIQGLLSHNIYFGDATLNMSMAGLETVYALDIVRFVPLLGFGLDGILSVAERQARGDFALHALLGVDFLINPRWIIGADARGFWVATNAQSSLGPFIITAALRLGFRFDLRQRRVRLLRKPQRLKGRHRAADEQEHDARGGLDGRWMSRHLPTRHRPHGVWVA